MTQNRKWAAYSKKTAIYTARKITLAAIEKFSRRAFVGTAIDIGCGSGNDSAELLSRGWQVYAIDSAASVIDGVNKRLGSNRKFKARQGDIRLLRLPKADLIIGNYLIPFIPPHEVAKVWQKIITALKPGGRFVGQFLAPQDTWVTTSRNVSSVSRAELRQLCKSVKVEHLVEHKKRERTASGKLKKWHYFEVMLRKPG